MWHLCDTPTTIPFYSAFVDVLKWREHKKWVLAQRFSGWSPFEPQKAWKQVAFCWKVAFDHFVLGPLHFPASFSQHHPLGHSLWSDVSRQDFVRPRFRKRVASPFEQTDVRDIWGCLLSKVPFWEVDRCMKNQIQTTPGDTRHVYLRVWLFSGCTLLGKF